MDQRSERSRILYDVLYAVFKRWFALAFLCAIAFLLTMFFTFLTTPTYKATAKILIRSNPQQQLILFKDLATPGQEAPTVSPARNLIQILTGRQVAQQVVERFGLDERNRKKREEPEEISDVIRRSLVKTVTYPITLVLDLVGVEQQSENDFVDAVEHFMDEAQDIQLEQATNVINLSIWEETPKLSSDIANYMAQLLKEKSTELEQLDATEAYDFTREQLKAAETALMDSEAALLEFKKSNDIIGLEEQKKAKLDEIFVLESQYINVKVDFSEGKGKMDEIRKTISAQKQLLLEAPIFANNPVMKELLNALHGDEIELAGTLERFTESSENVKTLRAQALETKGKIEKELKAVVLNDSAILQSIHPDLAKEYAELTANVAALAAKQDVLEKEMDALRAEVFSLSLMEAELERLTRRRETNEKLYTNLSDKFSQLEVQKAFQLSGYDLKIIDKASIPEDARPDWPNWLLLIPLGFMGGLLISIVAVFFVDYWDESFKSANEIEDRLGLSVLCTVPDIEPR